MSPRSGAHTRGAGATGAGLLLVVGGALFTPAGCSERAETGAASQPASPPASGSHASSQPGPGDHAASQPSAPAGGGGAVDGSSAPALPAGAVVVGTGEPGFSDDPPRFHKPIRLAAFGSDSVLVADIGNHAVRIVDVQGRVSTLVGGPDHEGYQDGPAAEARFKSPHGVAVLEDGSVVVAEAGNHTLRRLVPAGEGEARTWTVSTLAGRAGEEGFQDGAADAARFRSPHGILAWTDGSVLVADIGNARVRRVQGGQVTTLAGTGVAGAEDGPLATGTLSMPMDLTRAPDGGLIIADAGARRLRRWDAERGLTTPRLPGPLAMPHGVAVDDEGRFLVADLYGHQVVALQDERKPVLGTGAASSAPGGLNRPAAVLLHAGRLWVADLDNHQVKAVPWPPAP